MTSGRNASGFVGWILLQFPDFMRILTQISQDAFLYLPLFFIYSILAVIALPIPVEAGLFNPYINPILLVLTMAAGKGVGAFISFFIGTGIGSLLKGKSDGHALIKKIVGALERFVRTTGMIGLLIILSIPLMVDTIPVYLYSILHYPRRGKLTSAAIFALVNFIAGIIRASIVLAVAYGLGYRLV